MASISIPCPKASAIPRNGVLSRRVTSPLVGFSQISLLKGPNPRHFPILKAQVGTENSSSSVASTSKAESSNGKVGHESAAPVPESVISAFMAEVSDLVKLVDSRDITELQLKQNDCELIIRKKEALPQTATSAPVMMMQPSPQAMYQPPPPMPSAMQPTAPASAPPAASAPALPAPAKGSKSSHPLKCPMAGTFYRCPGPGEPPFVKVGDKVKKGQVVCIIEAMKLMNEIEADQDGTVVDIIAEDAKPVSVDTPLLVIEP